MVALHAYPSNHRFSRTPLSAVQTVGKTCLGHLHWGLESGVIASLISVYLLSLAFGLDQTMLITLLPKSITAAIAIGVAEEYQGIVTLTVAAVIITGITGNVIAEPVCKLFRIKNPIAKGIAIGTSSHVVGTSKAMEMGEVEGAMSSLAIVVAGLTTVILLSFILI
jgi:putative effector of murein hydrolase